MGKLICELCGSSDFIKQDGVFVCQSCEMKYSVEDAKKMMNEGTTDISGVTVKVNTSAKLQNLYLLARRAKGENNVQDAAKYYHEIRLEDPNSWEAAFYGVYYTALGSTVAQIEYAANSIANAITTAVELIKAYVPEEEQKEAYTACLADVFAAREMLCNAALNHIKNSGVLKVKDPVYDPVTRRYVAPTVTEAERTIKREFVSRCKACDEMLLVAAKAAEVTFNDYNLAYVLCTKGMEDCEKRASIDMGTNYTRVSYEFANIFKQMLEELEPKRREAQKKKNEEYWENHAEEKQKYDARIAEIDVAVNELQAQIKQYDEKIAEIRKELHQKVPAESQLATLREQRNALDVQKAKLGLFAGKQKRELQEQIDAMQIQINNMEETVSGQRKAIQDDVDTRISPIKRECKTVKDKIGALEEEKASINAELTKDR